MREELFEELPNNAKDLLKELLETEKEGNKIDEVLRKKIEEDKTDQTVRSIIGTLRHNGLLSVIWADDTVYYAEMTNAGKTYFEREKKYMERIEKMSGISVNIGSIGTITNTGFLNIGNITDSNIIINNAIGQLEKEIDKKGEGDKEELKQILDEVKDYLDNVKETNQVIKNTGLFKRISQHFEKHQWFYSKIIEILGQVVLLQMGS